MGFSGLASRGIRSGNQLIDDMYGGGFGRLTRPLRGIGPGENLSDVYELLRPGNAH